ncbi:MAG: heme biosynthesis HemY N-terminal domain-containing protein [Burkholderiales bacterium]
MKGLLWVVGVFAAAVALSLGLQDDGYVLITLPPWRVEISLLFAILVLIGGFVLGYFVVRLAGHALSLPAHVRAFRVRQRETRARQALVDALQALLEGRYSRVEKLAVEAFEGGATPELASLVGARAAARRRDFKRRDEWLLLARSGAAPWRNARLALEADLLTEERRFDEAKKTIEELHVGGLRHVSSQQLLLRCEQGLGNWPEVARLAQQLAKRGALTPEALRSVLSGAHIAQIARLSQDPSRLDEFWKQLPREQRVLARTAAAAARTFMQLGDCSGAHRLIEDALESAWEPDLVRLYGECAAPDTLTRIEHAERWLTTHPRDADLLCVLGKLCMERQLWGKAQSYLEASLGIEARRGTHIALARLFEAMGRAEDANRHYRASADVGISE